MSTNKRTPYTYLVGWSHLNKWYYGRRTAKNCHPSEFWVKYFTSSIEVASFRQHHGDPDVIKIRKIFKSVKKCCDWETRFLSRVDAKNNDKFLNRSNGDMNWHTTGINGFCSAKEFLTGKKLGRVSLDDPRWKTGEIVGTSKGRIQSKEEVEKRVKALLGKPSKRKGKPGNSCSEETKEKLRKFNQGKRMPEEVKKKISKSLTGLKRSAEQRENYRKPKNPLVIAKARTTCLSLSARPSVNELKKLATKHQVLLGKGWTRRSDAWINNKIMELKNL